MKAFILSTVSALALLSAFAEDNPTLLQRAESGDPEAQYELAQKYEAGEKGYAHDPDLAALWYKKAFAAFQTAAESGDPKAQYKLGQCYDDGTGIKRNPVLAAQWFLKSAEAGLAEAQYSLGHLYYYGRGVEEDTVKGLKWIIKAAEQGDVYAQRNLGSIYQYGDRYLEPNDEALSKIWYAKVIAHYKEKVDQGDLEARYLLGTIYYYGIVVPQDIAEAKRLLHEAAEQGNTNAQAILWELYETGFGGTKSGKDREKAKYWEELAVEEMSASSLIVRGNRYLGADDEDKDIQKGLWCYEKAAEHGSAEAHFKLGLLYLFGRNWWGESVLEIDRAKAVIWLRKAAELGNTEAQYWLSECYHNAWGVEKNVDLANEWKAKAFARHLERANNGDDREMFTVATAYANGAGVDKDPAMAMQWYRKAAEQGEINSQAALGHELLNGDVGDIQEGIMWLKKAVAQSKYCGTAQYDLGRCYENGLGVIKDTDKAEEYYWAAADNGISEARKKLGYLYDFYKLKNNVQDFVGGMIW